MAEKKTDPEPAAEQPKVERRQLSTDDVAYLMSLKAEADAHHAAVDALVRTTGSGGTTAGVALIFLGVIVFVWLAKPPFGAKTGGAAAGGH